MKKVLLGSFCLAFVACAPPTQFLKKSYPSAQLADKELAIYPVFAAQVQIQNDDDFADDFEDVKEEPAKFLAKEINDKAAKYFEAGFKYVKVASFGDSGMQPLNASNSQRIADKINKDEFEIRVPNSTYLENRGLKPRFVLVLDQAVYSRNLKTSQTTMASAPVMGPGGKMVGGGAPMSMTSTTKYLAFGVNYLIYDYEDKAVVGYGFAEGQSNFNFAMTRSDWYKSMENAFGKIKAFSPFK
jgi:hypothetical protein